MRAVFLWASLLSFAPQQPVADHQHQVLAVYSTRRDAQIAIVGERELPRLLDDGLGGRLDYYAEFIDPARFSEENYQAALAEFLTHKYQDHRFDAIIALGDEALAFIDRYRQVFVGAPPVVFHSAIGDLRRMANSTGVITEYNLGASVALAATLDPGLQHVFVVSGAEAGDVNMADLARRQFRSLPRGLDVTYLTGLTTKALEDRLTALPPHSAVYYLVVDQDGTGQYFHPLQYLDKIAGVANAPIYSWVDSTLDHGVVGGALKSQPAQVAAIANVALRVLRGEPADSIPVAFRDFNVTEVDWRQLRRWRLSESRLPAGTQVLFRNPSAWERYRPYILGALLVLFAQSALIAGLLVQRRQRRKAEHELIDSQAQLRASYSRIRDLGARLLNAQDAERSHIARELHDDISQQLALIEIDLKAVEQPAPGPARSDLLAETLSRLHDVSRSVRDLSHRLHPARLRLIGLVAALKGLQSEMSPSGISVTFAADNVPPSLPPDVTVCLFRVAQEVLQNALKYSHAQHVAVRLSGESGRLVLSAEDDGVGFDLDAAWGRGLGLLSMRERVEAIGGDLKIRSTPGAGTSVRVSVPLTAADAGAVAV